MTPVERRLQDRVVRAAMRWYDYLQEWQSSSNYGEYTDEQLDAKQTRLEKAWSALAAHRKGKGK